MSAIPNRSMTADEFLAWEIASDAKHEFIEGEIIAFAGASPNHAQIAHNLSGIFYNHLRKSGCRTYVADIRVRVGKSRAYTYPDLVIACGELKFADSEQGTLLNPTIIVEVLSPSTAMIDRVKKFDLYTAIPSLQEYLLVAQDRTQLEQFVRQPDGRWLYAKVRGSDANITLPSIDLVLVFADVYENVTFSDTSIDEEPNDLI
jgi:Uma2 family endonuclease